MAEEIKELIEKIQREGIQAAEEKAREIESQAKKEAEEIIQRAKNEAEKIISLAQEKIGRQEEASKTSLSQAGRNLLISLRKEINTLLDKALVLSVREALTPNELVKILHSLITESAKPGKSNIIVSLNKEDLTKLEKSFFAELKEEAKKGVILKAKDDIQAGFLISFDAGKSHFDFTDKSLAEYIGEHLKPELAKILKEVS